jgi:hypothetical protein
MCEPDPDIAGQLMEYDDNPAMRYFERQPMPRQPQPDFPLAQSIDDLADALVAMRNVGQPVIISQLLAQLKNVMALSVQQPKFLVRRRTPNGGMVVPMTEKQLYKALRDIGLITYVDVRTTQMDKLVKKDDFQRALPMFTRGDDGMYYELHR